jgi:hypothetical protein
VVCNERRDIKLWDTRTMIVEWQPLFGVNILIWTPNITKTLPLPTLTIFFPHSNHLRIAWLMSLWVDIHVGLMVIIILIADEWVRHLGKISSMNPKWVVWRVRV